MNERADWPELPYADWAGTRYTLHMVAQMLGKAKLALAPPQPEWMHARLLLDPRGFTTGSMPHGSRTLSMLLDVVDGAVRVAASDGRTAAVTLGPGRSVADIWAEFLGALTGLGVQLDLWDKPQEVADPTPFSRDTRERVVVLEHAQRFHRVLCSVSGVFEEYRSRFFGRSGIQFWWGAFDLALLLFNGRAAKAPEDRGYIMRYDLDAEHLNAGFWAGDDGAAPGIYGYIVPRPPGCETVPIAPRYAGWVEEMGEWFMPYEEVRTCPDPRAAILDFLEAVYGVATSLGGWKAAAHEYVRPPAPPRGSGRAEAG